MKLFERLRRYWQPEQRSQHVLIDANDPFRTVGGVTVNADTAMRVAAVHACCKILSESVAQLPLDMYRRRPNGDRKLATSNSLYRVLHDRPNSWQSSFEWREQNMLYVLYRGNAVNEIKVIDGQVELHPIHPSRVRIEMTDAGSLVYLVRNNAGNERRLLQSEVFHVRGPSLDGIVGTTPIQAMAATIGASLASDNHNVSVWKNGARPGVVLETEQALPQNAIPEIRDQWNKLYAGSENSGKTAVLERGIKAHVLGLNHTDLQFIEQQKMNASQIASVFRVPPHMIGLMDSATFSNIEHQQLSFVKMTLMPYLERWEQSIQRDLIDDDRYYAEFNVEGLLRGDTAARSAFYREMFGIGALSVDEIRRFENFNPVEGGSAHFVNMALNTLENAAKGVIPSADKAAPVDMETPAEDNTDTEPETDVEQQQDAARSLWSEQVRSLVRWECDAITRAAKKPHTFLTECESFIAEHQTRMVEKLASAERMCRSVGVEVSAVVFAAEHRAETWSKILKVSETTTAELPSHVDAMVAAIKEQANGN